MSRQKDNVVRMEKKATNHFGLFLLFIVVIGGFGYGGYYLYKHRNDIDWNIKLPWKKEKEEEVKPGTALINPNTTNKNNKLIVPNFNSQSIKNKVGQVKIYDLAADDKGYTFQVDLTASSQTATLSIEKVLIDGFDTSAKLTITDMLDSEKAPTTSTLRINKSELDSMGIYAFNKFSIYYRISTDTEKGDLNRSDFQVYNTLEYKNALSNLIEIYHKENILIYFYKTESDKDNTYIYFDVINENRTNPKKIKIKKLILNGEIYEYKDFDESIYCGTNRVIYLTIPKKKISEVENITISFFVISQDQDENTTAVHLTPEYSKSF